MSINTSFSHVSMACIPTFHPAWTTIPAQPQGPVIEIIKAIQDMQGFDYLPPPGYEFAKPPLGTGGCGKVYLAKNCSTGDLYAVKCVKISDAYTHLMARGLWNEVKILKDHPHQNIITCHGAWQSPTDSSIRYLFLEYMDMGSVKHLYSNGANTINERFVRECIQHVLAGLVHLHDLSIIHRDLKGDNILKDSKGLYKIADFGLSKRCNIDSASGGYCLMTPGVGTPTHMAPELKDPTLNVPYDMNMMKVDIWSLGCLVLEISSCGTFTVSVVNQHAEYNLPPIITPQCTHFIQWCLQVNPINRPTSRMLLNHDWFKILL